MADVDVWTEFIEARLATEAEFIRVARRLAKITRRKLELELTAKRAILAEHKHVIATFREDGFPPDGFGCQTCARVEYGVAPEGWCATIRALASFWADHAGFPGLHENTVV